MLRPASILADVTSDRPDDTIQAAPANQAAGEAAWRGVGFNGPQPRWARWCIGEFLAAAIAHCLPYRRRSAPAPPSRLLPPALSLSRSHPLGAAVDSIGEQL
jgi:hypothetical protein